MTIRRAALRWPEFIICVLLIVFHVTSSICRTHALSTSLVRPGARLIGRPFRRQSSLLRDSARNQQTRKAPAMDVEPFVEDGVLENDTAKTQTITRNVSAIDEIDSSLQSNAGLSQQTSQPSLSDDDNYVTPEQQPALQVDDSSTSNEKYASSMNANALQPSSSNPEQQQPAVMLHAPSVRRILEFSIPAIAVWLCSPLLSVIDTSTVGLCAGTAQQAALNPAVAIADYSARCLVRTTISLLLMLVTWAWKKQ